METVAYLLYLFVLLFSPLAFGTIDLWAVSIVEGCSFLALGCYLLAILRNDQSSLKKTPGLTPLLIFLAWMAFQVVPLPRSLVAFISPATASMYEPLLSVGLSPDAFIPLSLHPLSTIQEFFRFSAFAACYFLTVQLLDEPRRMRQTLTLVLTLAAGIALYGIVQHYTGNDRIYGFRTFTHKPVFGSFAYKNHFAGYAELLLPLGLATFFYFRHLRIRVAMSPANRSFKPRSLGVGVQDLFFLMVSCLMVLAVLLSKSRGGVICAFVAVGLLFIIGRRHFRLAGILPIVITLSILVVATGVGRDGLKTVAAGFGANLAKDIASMNGRVEIWKNSVRMIADFPLTGTGGGTFRAVYPRYVAPATGSWAIHAHNEYLETQSNGGLIASLSLAAFLFAFFRATLAMFRNRQDGNAIHLYLGSLAGLAAIFLHCLIELQFRSSAAVALYFFFVLGVHASSIAPRQTHWSILPTTTAHFSGIPGWSLWALLSLSSLVCLIFQLGEWRALALFPEISTIENRLGKAGYETKANLLALESFALYQKMTAEQKKDVCERASQAQRLSPLNPRYRYIGALCASQEDTPDLALEDCRAAFRLSPAQALYSQQYLKLMKQKSGNVTAAL